MSLPRLEAMAPPGDMVYRTPVPLAPELVKHCTSFFEDYLYTQALDLLTNTLASGTYASKKAIIPCVDHLAIAATLLVHPTTTTRPERIAEEEAAHLALRLLRLLTTLVTPSDAKLDLAFSFARAQTSRSGLRSHKGDSEVPEEHCNDSMPLHLKLAAEDSLWSRAEDFWHVVGWAFNCSVLHPGRWEYWQMWLEFMCGVIEEDWTLREQAFQSQPKRDDSPAEDSGSEAERSSPTNGEGLSTFEESLIFQYMSGVSVSGKVRRIFRAIFADGTSGSLNEFRQVFNKELARHDSNQHSGSTKKRDRVNIERGEYGDYISEDDTDEEINEATGGQNPSRRSDSPVVASKPRRSKRARQGTRSASDLHNGQDVGKSQASTHQAGIPSLGGYESLNLRKRLLDILLKVSMRLPRKFVDAPELFELFVENIRHQPLPIFQAFVSPYVLPQFSDAAQSTLCEVLLFNMRESSAPGTDEGNLTQEKLELCFLPYAAANASVINNTKMSILLEACIVLLAKSNMLQATDEFKETVQSGILHRAERAQDEIRRSQSSRQQEPIEWCWLVESGERLNYLVEVLQPV
ncbi:hypothetical protein N7492_005544 [Penicillium capsulatum]|uniref:Uncharacterized protein n=1 Tax=Penicillium capsulatum TaxID=69766 RepID=A0A9W9ICN9_9EURO|nr:hypothetical protein N7492_005544 [Penicillium capsulatum]KAJ6135354.1 hypothetical protein N7512_000514 [Penicillium capsulatum]